MKYTLLKNDWRDIKHPHKNERIRVYRLWYLETVSVEVNGKVYTIEANSPGGFLQSTINMDDKNLSLVLNNSIVFGQAITRNCVIRDSAAIFDDAFLENCEVFGHAKIFGKTNAKRSLFRDNTNIGGVLHIEDSYFANSSNVSGICKIFNTKMHTGARISGQSEVDGCILHDTVEITGMSKIRNCILNERAFVKNEVLENQSITETIELYAIKQKGDLFPH